MIWTLIAQFGDGFKSPGTGIFDPLLDPCGIGAATSLGDILSLILGFLTILAGLAFLLYFVFAALQWTLAGGDQGKVDTAKKQMTNGAIGLIIVIVSYGIMAIIGSVLGVDLLNPGDAILGIANSNIGSSCPNGLPSSGTSIPNATLIPE